MLAIAYRVNLPNLPLCLIYLYLYMYILRFHAMHSICSIQITRLDLGFGCIMMYNLV